MASTRAPRTSRHFLESLESRLLLSNTNFSAGRALDYVAANVGFADINTDGRADFINDNGNDQIFVAYGTGNTNFGALNLFPALSLSYRAAVDLNNDGKVDIITASENGTTARVFLSTGSGNFATPQDLTTGASSKYIAVGKLNNDAFLDFVLVTDTAPYTLTAFLNNGDGTFAAGVSSTMFTTPGNNFTVAIGDFNGDGNGDLAANNLISKGNGNGTFGNAIAVPGMPGNARVATGDFNNDGKADLVAADTAANMVYVFTGTTTAALLALKGSYPTEGNATTSTLVVGDFSADGKLDFALQAGQRVNIFTNAGTAVFVNKSFQSAGLSSSMMLTADINNDGFLDLISLDSNSSQLQAMLNKGNGTFNVPMFYEDGTTTSNIEFLYSGDLTLDGRADLISTTTGNSVSLRASGLDGSFTLPYYTFGMILDREDAGMSAIADVTGDGKADLIVVDDFWAGFYVYQGLGGGALGGGLRVDADRIDYGQYVTVADVNHDGWNDVILATDVDINIYLNGGLGSFFNFISYPAPFATLRQLVTGDFNGDTHMDIAMPGGGGQTVRILYGVGNGTFNVTNLNLGFTATDIATGDFNGDHRADLAVLSADNDNVYTLLSNINGSLVNSFNILAVDGGARIVAGDFNDDSISDVAVLAHNNFNNDGIVAVLTGKGNGSFSKPLNFVAGENSSLLVTGDVNRDGKLDLITTHAVLLNISSTTPTITDVAVSQTSSTYGDSLSFTVNVTADEGVPNGQVKFFVDNVAFGAAVNVVNGVAVLDTQSVPAGNHTIKVSYLGNSSFSASFDTVQVTIAKADLSVTLNPAARVYGVANPVFTGVMIGKLGSDNITLAIKTAATKTSHPGDYGLTFTFVDPQKRISNYNVTSTLANLTISKADQAITWPTPDDMFVGFSALTSKQLNAKAVKPAGGSPNGALTYDRQIGEVLPLGDTLITVTAAGTQDYNQTSVSVSIKVKPPGPDLKVSLGAFTPIYTLVPGETIKVPVTLQNTGNQIAGATKALPIQILLRSSTTNVYDANDPLIFPAILITAPLNPGAKKLTTATIKLPLNFDPGAFFITTGLVDPNVASDPNPDNNEAATATPFNFQRQFGILPGRKPPAIYNGVDADGTTFKISLSGPGSGQVTVNGADLDLVLSDTTSKTTLTITATKSKTPGDNGVIDIHSITAGILGNITALTTTLTGPLSLASGLTAMSLYAIKNSTLDIAGAIKTLTVKTNITNSTLNAVSIGTATITGNIVDSTIRLSQAVGTTKALTTLSANNITNSVLRSVGNVGTIKAKTLDHSTIFLGVLDSVTTLPAAAADFTPGTTALLSSLTITTFTNSIVAASKVAVTKITTVSDLDAGVTPFGFATLVAPQTYTGPASNGDYKDPKNAIVA